jgi:hypothetical protein
MIMPLYCTVIQYLSVLTFRKIPLCFNGHIISSDLKIEQLHNYEIKTVCCILFVLVTAMNVVVILEKNMGTALSPYL